MDIRDNKITPVVDFLNICTDDYIISLANKGLLKRGRKEIDKGVNFSYSFEEGYISCSIDEDIRVKIGGEIETCNCSCPAKTLCKHIIISMLLLKDEVLRSSNDVENDEAPFRWMEDLNIDELTEKLTLKDIDEILFRMSFPHAYNIVEEQAVTVDVRGGFKVVIPKNSELSRIACSCGTQEVCNHKVESIIAYLMTKEHIKSDDMIESLSRKSFYKSEGDFDDELEMVEDLLEKITRNGLVRLPLEILGEIEVRALNCGEVGLPHMEKLLRGLRGNLQDYFDKRADFSNIGLLRRLTRIALSVRALKGASDDNLKIALIGEKRSRYISIGELKLVGLGADKWKTKSGYEGITYYFYNNEYRKIFTYSDMAGDTSESSLDRYKTGTGWNMDVSMMRAVKGVVVLEGCMVNKKNRISSSESTGGKVVSENALHHLNFDSLEYDSWTDLLDNKERNFTFSLIKNDENANIVILKPQEYGDVHFDKVTQRICVPLFDGDSRVINMYLNYENEKEDLFDALEDATERSAFGDKILGRVYKMDNELCIYPISFYYGDGTMLNIHLDR